MQGHIHQAVVLTAFGNEFLRTGAHTPAFWPDNVAFQYSKRTIFVDGMPKPGQGNPELCSDPLRWVTWLKSRGIRAIRLVHVHSDNLTEDYNTVVFGGGGRWIVEALKSNSSELWQSSSEVVDQNAPDKKIWADTFYRTAADWQQYPVEQPDLDHVHNMLAEWLPKALAFAKKHKELSDFTDFLQSGIKALDSNAPLAPGATGDFDRCTLLSPRAKQLIGAAGHAWVFGGMGWWNDNQFQNADVQKEFLSLSGDLWAALTMALVDAANSTMPFDALAQAQRA